VVDYVLANTYKFFIPKNSHINGIHTSLLICTLSLKKLKSLIYMSKGFSSGSAVSHTTQEVLVFSFDLLDTHIQALKRSDL